MSQQPDDQVQDHKMPSQVSREDEETCSTRATSGSSDLGSDDLGLVPTLSLSSEPGLRRPMTRRFLQDLQASQTNRLDAGRAARETLSPSNSSLRGLTPPPLPSSMVPSKKRSLGEVLGDESPPEKDKMSAEIDQLAGGELGLSHASPAGPSGTQSVAPTRTHQRKKSRVSEESSTFRMLPRSTVDSATDRDGPGSPERRRDRVHDAPRVRNRETSD
ncbi:hypothetical protein F5Y10DRAFT_194865 [Nemania abortiva]|nr:hypothetical protein F5Y10DRAFT_194865 [Nemania abortiva]